MVQPDISLFECISTQRAIRHFASDPVPEEAVFTVLRAAIRAPSGGNTQPWHFLVIRDRETKRRFGEWYLRAWSSRVAEMGPRASSQPYRSGGELAQAMGDVPVLILACIDREEPGREVPMLTRGASIYPALQNLMLAARALGLGTVLTTLHTQYEREVKELLGIPDTVDTAALVPLGYPAEGARFGGSRRKPVEEVVFHERWGARA